MAAGSYPTRYFKRAPPSWQSANPVHCDSPPFCQLHLRSLLFQQRASFAHTTGGSDRPSISTMLICGTSLHQHVDASACEEPGCRYASGRYLRQSRRVTSTSTCYAMRLSIVPRTPPASRRVIINAQQSAIPLHGMLSMGTCRGRIRWWGQRLSRGPRP